MLQAATSTEAPARAPLGAALAVTHLVAVAVAVAMGAIAVRHASALGSDAPFVHDLLALDGSMDGAGAIGGALDSWSQFVFFAVLLWAAAAAVLLLIGSVGAMLGFVHRDVALRLTRMGLWLSLLLCLAAMVPLEGIALAQGWEEAVGDQSGSVQDWDPLFRNVALLSGGGLLALAVAVASAHRTVPAGE